MWFLQESQQLLIFLGDRCNMRKDLQHFNRDMHCIWKKWVEFVIFSFGHYFVVSLHESMELLRL